MMMLVREKSQLEKRLMVKTVSGQAIALFYDMPGRSASTKPFAGEALIFP